MAVRAGCGGTADQPLALQNLKAQYARLASLLERASQLAGRETKLGGGTAGYALGRAVHLDRARECSPGRPCHPNGKRLRYTLNAAALATGKADERRCEDE